ncbi:hypothetical protein QBC35DRAFT_379453 [Podospora australis]|uniref:holo-[acyl-carrier-protein] synthase n=1 Tax=Podospora australis TaxID=1536484 RepID=A0AAN6WWZ2_9PEZI|nr:hypothetical protein QBC35DRAFT_379453 [Podospora australis]
MGEESTSVIAQWLFDTRPWFPGATETRHLESHATRALSLLTSSERAAVLKYFHLRDAKMAIASALLKHYAIAKLSPTTWSGSVISRGPPPHSKPMYTPSSPECNPVSFNVSHQAGLVALVAMPSPTTELGVDIVCTSERQDRDLSLLAAKESGWRDFVDMHADVFSPHEVTYLKYQVLSSLTPSKRPATPEGVNAWKLREFYALWALREAYVKLTGEALLADWLRDLEFRNFRSPRGTASWDTPADEFKEGDEAEVIRTWDIRRKGQRILDVNMCLRSLGPDYMIATAVKTPHDVQGGLCLRLGAYEHLELEKVLTFAEANP